MTSATYNPQVSILLLKRSIRGTGRAASTALDGRELLPRKSNAFIHKNTISINVQRLQQVTVSSCKRKRKKLQRHQHKTSFTTQLPLRHNFLYAFSTTNTHFATPKTVTMDESNLLARTGKKLRKTLKAFRIHLKRVQTRPQTNSRINDHSSTLADLTSLQSILQTHNSRIRTLNKHKLHFQERSLRRMLAGQLRLHPTIGAETSTWRFKRAMSATEHELRREAVALEGIERAVLTALQALLRSYQVLRTIEQGEEFQFWASVVAMTEKLQRKMETRAVDEELKQEAREALAAIEPQLAEVRSWVVSVKVAVLKLARQASERGVKVARQTLLEEYFEECVHG